MPPAPAATPTSPRSSTGRCPGLRLVPHAAWPEGRSEAARVHDLPRQAHARRPACGGCARRKLRFVPRLPRAAAIRPRHLHQLLPRGPPRSASVEDEACGVTSLGAAVCWRYTPTETSVVANVVFVPGLGAAIRAIGGGPTSGCALTATGEVRCWGASRGDGNTYGGDSPASVLALPPEATEIAVGRRQRCARGSSGRVWCWGGLSGVPTDGEIGDGTRARALVAIEVASLPGPATSIATGSVHTCAMTPAGVFCWAPTPTVSWATGRQSDDAWCRSPLPDFDGHQLALGPKYRRIDMSIPLSAPRTTLAISASGRCKRLASSASVASTRRDRASWIHRAAVAR